MLRDLLAAADLSESDVKHLVELAASLGGPGDQSRRLAGELVVVYLTQPAPQAQRAFSTAAERLGARVVVLGPEEFQEGHGATVTDIARTTSLFAAVVVACTTGGDVEILSATSRVPVLDGRRALDEVCPILADLLARRNPGSDPAERAIRCAAALLAALRRRELTGL